MDNKSSFIKTDNNYFINEQSIVWVKKMNECLKVTTVHTDSMCNIHKICKLNNPNSYNKLNDKLEDL